MNWLTVFICHLLLVTVALALPSNKVENKPSETTTTAPNKETKSKQKESVVKSNKLEKSTLVARKRDLPRTSFEDSLDQIYGGKSVEEYAKALALGPSFDSSRIENTILKAEAYGDPASVNDYRYYGGEDRKKRTAIFDLYRPGGYSKRELENTPDEVIHLLALREALQQPQRIEYFPIIPQNRWAAYDNSLDPSETDLDDGDIYNEFPDNSRFSSFDDLYDRPQWGNFVKDKRFMVSKRSSFIAKPKIAVPIYRRAVL